MDQVLTRKIQQWLQQPDEEQTVEEGATLLLQLNRNRILFRNIIMRPEKMKAKLVYELNKHLKIRLDGKTLDDVVQMQAILLPSVQATLDKQAEAEQTEAPTEASEEGQAEQAAAPKLIGRYELHDQLPDHIKALYDENGARFVKIKELYNTLLEMEDAPICDRYEYLKQLESIDRAYHQAWSEYDAFVQQWMADEQNDPEQPDGTTTEQPEPEAPATETPAPIDTKAVNAARKYLSEKKAALTDMQPEDEAFAPLLAKMQERVDLVLASGGTFKPDYQAELEALGLKFE